MNKKFDPAPHDKYADSQSNALREDRAMGDRLDEGLMDSFPASDPVSHVQPSNRMPDVDASESLWKKIVSVFQGK